MITTTLATVGQIVTGMVELYGLGSTALLGNADPGIPSDA